MTVTGERALPIVGVDAETGEPADLRTLDQFLAETERRAFRIAQYATGDAEDALDLVQEAMFGLVRAYRNRPPEEWAPLFHRVLQSRIRDWQRRTWVRRRWRVWLGSHDAESADAEDPLQAFADANARNPSDLTALGHATTALRAALEGLPRRQREAFLLRVWEGLDVAQTALAMGCSEGSVKTHYSRAVHALRDMLEDHWDARRD